jgi:hypothetical protein
LSKKKKKKEEEEEGRRRRRKKKKKKEEAVRVFVGRRWRGFCCDPSLQVSNPPPLPLLLASSASPPKLHLQSCSPSMA